MFEAAITKFHMPKSKNVEILLLFSGEGTKMAKRNLGGEIPKMAKIIIFRKLRQVEVSASDMWLRVYRRKVLIFF